MQSRDVKEENYKVGRRREAGRAGLARFNLAEAQCPYLNQRAETQPWSREPGSGSPCAPNSTLSAQGEHPRRMVMSDSLPPTHSSRSTSGGPRIRHTVL